MAPRGGRCRRWVAWPGLQWRACLVQQLGGEWPSSIAHERVMTRTMSDSSAWVLFIALQHVRWLRWLLFLKKNKVTR